MKRILILLAIVFFSCAEEKGEPSSTITVNDDKGKMVSLMMNSYVINKLYSNIISDIVARVRDVH